MALTVTGIRTDVIARLKGRTVADQSVHDSLVVPVDGPDEMPCLNVFIPSTREEFASLAAPTFKATTTLRIDGYLAGDDEAALAAALDAFEMETRRVLLTDAAWVRQFEPLREVSAQRGFSPAGGKLWGQFVLSLDLRYRTSYPPVAEDPFTALRITVDVIGPTEAGPAPDGSPEATQDIELPGAELPEEEP